MPGRVVVGGGGGQLGRGGGVLQDNDDADVTPYGRPDFVALGLKNKRDALRKTRAAVPTAREWLPREYHFIEVGSTFPLSLEGAGEIT